MATKKTKASVQPKVRVVDYSFGSRTYQIDTERHKVYRQFVEIESARASTIFASWRASNA